MTGETPSPIYSSNLTSSKVSWWPVDGWLGHYEEQNWCNEIVNWRTSFAKYNDELEVSKALELSLSTKYPWQNSWSTRNLPRGRDSKLSWWKYQMGFLFSNMDCKELENRDNMIFIVLLRRCCCWTSCQKYCTQNKFHDLRQLNFSEIDDIICPFFHNAFPADVSFSWTIIYQRFCADS